MTTLPDPAAKKTYTDRDLGIHIALQLASGLPMWSRQLVHTIADGYSRNWATLTFRTLADAAAWAKHLNAVKNPPLDLNKRCTRYEWEASVHGWGVDVQVDVDVREPTPVHPEAIEALTAALTAVPALDEAALQLYPTPTRLDLLADVELCAVEHHDLGAAPWAVNTRTGRRVTAAIAELEKAGWVYLANQVIADRPERLIRLYAVSDAGQAVRDAAMSATA